MEINIISVVQHRDAIVATYELKLFGTFSTVSHTLNRASVEQFAVKNCEIASDIFIGDSFNLIEVVKAYLVEGFSND